MYGAAQEGTQNITRVLVLLFACCITEESICIGKINLVSMQASKQHRSARDGKGAPIRGLVLSRLAGIPHGCGLKCSWAHMRQHTDKLNDLDSGENMKMVCSALIPTVLFNQRTHNTFQRRDGIMSHGTNPFGSLIKATAPLHLHWHELAAGLHLKMIPQVPTTTHKVC